MEQLIVENIQPVIGKIIELIILLSQIDVIRIRLRAPFEKESEEGYTNQGSGQTWSKKPLAYVSRVRASMRHCDLK